MHMSFRIKASWSNVLFQQANSSGSEPSTEGWLAFGQLCEPVVLALLLVLMGFLFFLLFSLKLDGRYLSINSGVVPGSEVMRLTKVNLGGQKNGGNFKVLVCLLAPAPFFFCVLRLSSEVKESADFLVVKAGHSSPSWDQDCMLSSPPATSLVKALNYLRHAR